MAHLYAVPDAVHRLGWFRHLVVFARLNRACHQLRGGHCWVQWQPVPPRIEAASVSTAPGEPTRIEPPRFFARWCVYCQLREYGERR